MLLGVDSRLRKLSFCTVHACTDSSNKALRESRLCISIAVRRANINQTDAQVWAELRDRHQWLGNLTEWFESWRYNCAPPSSRRYANRRDYSSLESI